MMSIVTGWLQIGSHQQLLRSHSVQDASVHQSFAHAGPSTAAGMAAAKGWQSMLVPALLVGTFGYAVATPLSIVLGQSVLRSMVA